MKILWVKAGKLLPLNTGGKLRSYHIMRHLAMNHEVTYLSYYGGSRDLGYEAEIVQHLPGTVAICTSAADASPVHRFRDYLRRLPGPAPYAVSKFTAPEVRSWLAESLTSGRFDVAVCDFLSSTLNFPNPLAIPSVLFQHNVETMLWERKSRLETRWLDRVISRIECRKMWRYEPLQVRRFHHVIAVSEQDRRAMGSMVDLSHISVVPTGVDLARLLYDPELRPSTPLVVFAGSMDWEPNIDAVEYFCADIWPRVLTVLPGAVFRIVGRDPHRRVRRLVSASVEVTGTVPSIVDHLRQATVLVVPLRIGGGTRLKIYEGMAMGKATVSTSVGAEGLDVQHGRTIFLADDPRQFAEALILLLRDENQRRRYEAAAAATVRQYDWSVVAERFADVLARAVPAGSAAHTGTWARA